jgi:hypothetical protein
LPLGKGPFGPFPALQSLVLVHCEDKWRQALCGGAPNLKRIELIKCFWDIGYWTRRRLWDRHGYWVRRGYRVRGGYWKGNKLDDYWPQPGYWARRPVHKSVVSLVVTESPVTNLTTLLHCYPRIRELRFRDNDMHTYDPVDEDESVNLKHYDDMIPSMPAGSLPCLMHATLVLSPRKFRAVKEKLEEAAPLLRHTLQNHWKPSGDD